MAVSRLVTCGDFETVQVTHSVHAVDQHGFESELSFLDGASVQAQGDKVSHPRNEVLPPFVIGSAGPGCTAARPWVDGLAPPATLGRSDLPTLAKHSLCGNLTPGLGASHMIWDTDAINSSAGDSSLRGRQL